MNTFCKPVKLCEGDPGRPVLLCLPGAMCPPEIFSAMAQQSGHAAYGLAWLEGEGPFDLESVAARVSELVQGLGRVILVGHSIGTAIAVLAARRALAHDGASVAGMVLSNSGANTRGLGDIDALIDRLRTQWGPEFRASFAQRCIGTSVPDALMERLQAYPAQLEPTAVVAALESLKATDLLPVLRTLPAVPAAVVHGRFDRARTMTHAAELADAILTSSLHVLETGHTSAAEAPCAFANIVRETAG